MKMKKLPQDILKVREIILKTIPQNLFDKNGVWIHYRELRHLQHPAKKCVERQVLLYAQDLLAPLSHNEQCRQKRVKWRNRGYCPDAPYGNYYWAFHCDMVQEIIWMRPEFIAGFIYGSGKDPHKNRDVSPYRDYGSRDQSWDKGYILGLCWCYHPEKIKEWVKLKGGQEIEQ